MIYQIQQRLRDDLKAYMGSEQRRGWYTDDLIDDNGFNIRLDDTLVVFPNVTIVASLNVPEEYEISGSMSPTLLQYDVGIILMVRAADEAEGLALLEKLSRRVMRVVWTADKRTREGEDTLLNLSVSSEGMTESVTHFQLTDVVPDSREDTSNTGQFEHVALLNFRVRTRLNSIPLN